jgi:hypothetical protein
MMKFAHADELDDDEQAPVQRIAKDRSSEQRIVMG